MWHIQLENSKETIAVNVLIIDLGYNCSNEFLKVSIYTYMSEILTRTIKCGITFLVRNHKRVCSVAHIAVIPTAVIKGASFYLYTGSSAPFSSKFMLWFYTGAIKTFILHFHPIIYGHK